MALGVVAVLTVAPAALAQKKSGAEVSLVGIKLYDSGLRVVSLYGTPDSVESVNAGGAAIGPGGGGAPGGPGGRPSNGVSSPGAGQGPAGPAARPADLNSPFGFANNLMQLGGPASRPNQDSAQGEGSAGQSINRNGGGPAGPGGIGGGGGDTGGRILFTRWIYNRNGSKYGFVLDKSNRVVQIEAIGLSNPKVKTQRGITFGSTFAQLIRKYNAPDGYEISGDNVVVRFLVRNKVAFRLSRLGPNKPQVVTGIVVAAGKN